MSHAKSNTGSSSSTPPRLDPEKVRGVVVVEPIRPADRSGVELTLSGAGQEREDHGVTPLPELREGEFVDGGVVGRGGMGTVRDAFDRRLLRHVAVKLLDRSLLEHRDLVERFVAEAQITGQLEHPNIVPVHGLGEAVDGTPYFFMKLVHGRTLADEIRDERGLPWPSGRLDELLGVLLKVCDAVAFAHSRGVIHRDIKPQNVMVGSFGQVYLMDWGVARVARDGHGITTPATSTSTEAPAYTERVVLNHDAGFKTSTSVLGTPAYMAPEQAIGLHESVDARTDVYALGVVLYEMLVGTSPHRGSTAMAVLWSAANGEVTPPEKARPDLGLPSGLCRIAMKALARLQDDRYQSVLELKTDIERYLRGYDRFPIQKFSAGERVVTEGDAGDVAFIITAGRCVAFRDVSGERVVLREMGSGDVFGETAVFTSKPRTASVEALESLTVMLVTRESLTEQLGLNTHMGTFVRAVAERFRETDQRLAGFERTRVEAERASLAPPSERGPTKPR